MRPCEQCQKPLERNAFSWRRFCLGCRKERDRASYDRRTKTPEYRALRRARQHALGVTPANLLHQRRRAKMLAREALARTLIAKGLSTREVARQLGTTVGVIAGLRHRVRWSNKTELTAMEQQGQ